MNKEADSRDVIGYARVSTTEQSNEGVSLDAQREKIRLYAELHGLDLVELVTDAGVSAKSLDRPGLTRVLDLLERGESGGLVVYKLDRLTRSLGDWSELIDRFFGERGNRSLMSVSESIDTRTAGGRMVLNIMMTVAQWERETIVERTRAAVDYKRSKNERIGCIPYGWQLAPDGKQLVADAREQTILAQIDVYRHQGWSLRRIADYLEEIKIPTKRGGRWSPSTIHTLTKTRT